MITIHTYRDKIISLTSRPSQAAAQNVFGDKITKVMAALGILLQEAEPILFKDGRWRRPNLIRAIKLGWLAFTFIKTIFSNE